MIVDVATEADIDAVSGLEGWFPEGQRWSDNAWAEEVLGEDRFVLVARIEDTEEVVGAATFQLIDDTVDLHRIVVAGPFRRRGFARIMMMSGLHWALQAGAARMILEVRSDNDNAIALYRTYGFVPISERPNYYAPGAHALVLELVLEGLDVDAIGPWGTGGVES